MTNLVVILDDVEMHMCMFKCLYTTIHTIYIYPCVSVKKIIYIYVNINVSSQYLVCICNRYW